MVTDTLPAANRLYFVSELTTVCSMTAVGSSAASSSWLLLTYTYFGPQDCGVKVIVPGFTVKSAFAGRSTVTVTSDVGSESSLMVYFFRLPSLMLRELGEMDTPAVSSSCTTTSPGTT